MADELDLAAQFIYGLLSADTIGAGSLETLSPGITSRIYRGLIPQEGSSYPAIVFAHNGSRSVYTISNTGGRLMVDSVWQVRVHGEDHTFFELSPIYSRVDALIDHKKGPVTGGTIVHCRQTDPIDAEEDVDGVIYRHLGGLYMLGVQAA